MKKIKKMSVTLLLAIVMAIIVPSMFPVQNGIETVEAASIKISTKKQTLIKGQNKTLKVSGTKAKVTWSSNKKSVATVNSKGKVTAKAKGTATITAKVGSKKLTCKVTVETPKISKTSLSLNVNKTATLKLTGTTQKVKWSSNKTSVATVSSSGKVSAKKAGVATITAAVGDKKYKCKVTVVDNIGKLQSFILANGTSFTNDSGATYFYRYIYPISSSEAVYLQYSPNKNVIQIFYHQDLGYKEAANTIIHINSIKDTKREVVYSYSSFGGTTILYNATTYIYPKTYTANTKLEFTYSGVTENTEKMYTRANSAVQEAFKKIPLALNKTVKLNMKDLGFTAY